jgi:ATP/maltotriose-dependent transcriptional regulator MalT
VRAGDWAQEGPLVGRSAEVSAIGDAWSRGAAGCVLSGPAGVGKSRIALAGSEAIRMRGSMTLAVHATASAATVPLGAFASVVAIPQGLDDPFERMRLVAEAIRQRAAGGRLAVAVDDAHLLDAPSAAVVLDVAHDHSAFVLATVRDDLPCPDAVTALWKDAGALRFDVTPLSGDDTTALAESIAGGPIEQRAAEWVFRLSLGNALYARELVLGAISSGALRSEHGYWRLDGRTAITAPLADVIGARLAALDAAERDLIELLAVADSLTAAELVELCGAGTLERVEEAGLVVIEENADARLSHPLYAETVRSALRAFRARRVGSEAARILSDRPQLSAHDVMRVAEWRLAAGEPVDPDVMVEAARIANLSGRPELAAELAQRALAVGLGVPAALLLARAHTLRNRHAQAAAVLAAAEAELESYEDAAELLDQQTETLYWGLNDAEALSRLLARAELWWSSDDWQQRLVPLRIRTAHAVRAEGRTEQIDTLLAEAIDSALARQVEPLRAARLLYSGRGTDAWRIASAIRPHAPLRDHADDFASSVYLAVALETGEGWRELRGWADELLAEGARLGDESALARGALTLGALCFWEGRFKDARRWLAEGELQFERRDSIGLLAAARSLLVGVGCWTGDPDAAATALKRFHAALGPDGPLPSQRPLALRAEAWAAIAHGSADRAQAILLDGAERLATMPIQAARATYEALRAGAPAREIAPLLEGLAARSDAPLTGACARHATALAAGDGNALIAVTDELETIGALRYAAEAAAHAASAFARAGREDSARRAAARSQALCVEGQDGVRPPIAELAGPAITLTRRERQLAELAARGLSNPEIAERLVLSVRTVESHIFHVMQKLGVSDRREIASLIDST